MDPGGKAVIPKYLKHPGNANLDLFRPRQGIMQWSWKSAPPTSDVSGLLRFHPFDAGAGSEWP
jgi:hypothetical protein